MTESIIGSLIGTFVGAALALVTLVIVVPRVERRLRAEERRERSLLEIRERMMEDVGPKASFARRRAESLAVQRVRHDGNASAGPLLHRYETMANEAKTDWAAAVIRVHHLLPLAGVGDVGVTYSAAIQAALAADLADVRYWDAELEAGRTVLETVTESIEALHVFEHFEGRSP